MTPTLTRHTVRVNGIRMHVAEAGKGPPVVLLHGYPAGDVLRQVTWEGPDEYATAFTDDGDFHHGIGRGTYESKGKHRWQTVSVIQLSDGRRISTEGEIDLASRSWKGKISEMS
jgi:hypothetical protein